MIRFSNSKKETQLQERIERMYVMNEKLRGAINEQKIEIKKQKTEIKQLNANVKSLFKVAKDGIEVSQEMKKILMNAEKLVNKTIGKKIPKQYG